MMLQKDLDELVKRCLHNKVNLKLTSVFVKYVRERNFSYITK